MSSLLSQKHLQDEEAAYAWVEAHIWPHGPECPHCGQIKRISKMQGKATRVGLYKCYACRKQFRVTVEDHLRKEPCPAAPVASGHSSDREPRRASAPTSSTAP